MKYIILTIIFVIVISLRFFSNTPEAKGRRSEQAVTRKLEADSLRKHSGLVLTNIYVPKPSGDTAEIDVLYLTHKGLVVLKTKTMPDIFSVTNLTKTGRLPFMPERPGMAAKKPKRINSIILYGKTAHTLSTSSSI